MEMDTDTGFHLCHSFLPGYLFILGIKQQRHRIYAGKNRCEGMDGKNAEQLAQLFIDFWADHTAPGINIILLFPVQIFIPHHRLSLVCLFK